MEQRIEVVNFLVDTDVRDYDEVARWIKRYYKDQERVMREVKGEAQG